MRKYEFIHKMPTDQLREYATQLSLDIEKRRSRGREFSSLRHYLGIANLELETRQRRENMLKALDERPSKVDYAWQARKDCGV